MDGAMDGVDIDGSSLVLDGGDRALIKPLKPEELEKDSRDEIEGGSFMEGGVVLSDFSSTFGNTKSSLLHLTAVAWVTMMFRIAWKLPAAAAAFIPWLGNAAASSSSNSFSFFLALACLRSSSPSKVSITAAFTSTSSAV